MGLSMDKMDYISFLTGRFTLVVGQREHSMERVTI